MRGGSPGISSVLDAVVYLLDMLTEDFSQDKMTNSRTWKFHPK